MGTVGLLGHLECVSADVDLSFDGWGENGISEVRMEPPLGVEDLIELADSCARQLREKQELLTLHASLSSGEEHACSLDGSACGPEMPEPASTACKVQVSGASCSCLCLMQHTHRGSTPAGKHQMC
jgi:hypothetical protein